MLTANLLYLVHAGPFFFFLTPSVHVGEQLTWTAAAEERAAVRLCQRESGA